MLAPQEIFWSPHYLRHNQRRQEHLASLGLDLAAQTVLEVGAGLGDHTSFFLDRGCDVIVSEPQEQNLAILRERYPQLDVRQIDLNQPSSKTIPVDVVYCYGTLYHLQRPAEAIAWMGRCARSLLLMETCVAAGDTQELHAFEELASQPDNAVTGHGRRSSRAPRSTEGSVPCTSIFSIADPGGSTRRSSACDVHELRPHVGGIGGGVHTPVRDRQE